VHGICFSRKKKRSPQEKRDRQETTLDIGGNIQGFRGEGVPEREKKNTEGAAKYLTPSRGKGGNGLTVYVRYGRRTAGKKRKGIAGRFKKG